jgi:hypothetical protein
MLSPFAPAKNRTSGPKGHKGDNIYAGDKSPAYPEDEFFPQPVKPVPTSRALIQAPRSAFKGAWLPLPRFGICSYRSIIR